MVDRALRKCLNAGLAGIQTGLNGVDLTIEGTMEFSHAAGTLNLRPRNQKWDGVLTESQVSSLRGEDALGRVRENRTAAYKMSQPHVLRRCLAVLLLCQAKPLGSLVSSLYAPRCAEGAPHRAGECCCDAAWQSRQQWQQPMARADVADWAEPEPDGLSDLASRSSIDGGGIGGGDGSDRLGSGRNRHRRTTAEPISFYAPDDSSSNGRRSRVTGWRDPDDDKDDLFLPPLPSQPLREGELGGELPSTREGRYGAAGGGRSEGYYAALQADPQQLRASDLNELLQPDYMSRLRFNNFPLQQYGVIFKLDVMLSNAIEMHRRPWALVAAEQGMREPDDDEILRAIGMRPERAIQQTFRWTDDWGETQKLAFEVRSLKRHN